jgi:hypothetical protein
VTVVSSFPNKEPIENYTDEPMNDEHDGLTNFMNLEVRFEFGFDLFMSFSHRFTSPVVRTSKTLRSPVRSIHVS